MTQNKYLVLATSCTQQACQPALFIHQHSKTNTWMLPMCCYSFFFLPFYMAFLMYSWTMGIKYSYRNMSEKKHYCSTTSPSIAILVDYKALYCSTTTTNSEMNKFSYSFQGACSSWQKRQQFSCYKFVLWCCIVNTCKTKLLNPMPT